MGEGKWEKATHLLRSRRSVNRAKQCSLCSLLTEICLNVGTGAFAARCLAMNASDAWQLVLSLSTLVPLHSKPHPPEKSCNRGSKMLQRLPAITNLFCNYCFKISIWQICLFEQPGYTEHPDYIPNSFTLTSPSKRERKKKKKSKKNVFFMKPSKLFIIFLFKGKLITGNHRKIHYMVSSSPMLLRAEEHETK